MLSKTAGRVKTNYTYNAANQLVGDGTFDYTYDKVGNLLKKQSDGGLVSYAYNARNLLESWTDGEHSESYRYNAATGMVYFRARFYEPEMNRFSQKDILRGSMTTPQTLNRYAYCINDPVNFIDPSGMRLVENDPREVRSDLIVPTGRAGTSGPSTNTNVSAKSAAQTAQNVRVQNRLDELDDRDSGKTADSSSASQTKNHVEQQARENGTSNGKENTKQACSSAPEVESANENDTPNCNSQDDMEKVKQIPEEQLKNDSVYQILYPEKGVVGYGISGTAGLGLDVGFSIMYVLDESRNGKWAVSFGIGGGLGGSFGITTYENREIVSIDEMEGSGTSVGGTIIMIGMEGDSSKGMSASVWKPSLGAEFHALINYTFVWE